MSKTLVLTNPITIDGKQVKELTYDPMKITVDNFLDAAALAASSERSTRVSVKALANDWSMHLYLGFFAIIAENPSIDVADLKRMSGYDVLAVADIGWLFTLRRSGAASGQSDSEASSETTPELSTAESETSEENA